MMRLVFTMAVFGALVVTPAAAEDVPAPLDPAIAQCIRDNAAKVEAAVPDLNTAVDFLTTKVCAEPVARQNALTTKHGQERMAAHWKDICDKQKAAKPHGDKDLAGMASWCATMGDGTNTGLMLFNYNDDEDNGLAALSNVNPPAAATALAARLLLDLRVAYGK